MAREVDFVVRFGATDRYRRRHLSEKGRILSFVVQYETQIGDKWYPVVRYDTAHGFYHKDLMHPGKRSEKIYIKVLDYNKALTLAEKDIKDNWEEYRESFMKEIEKHESPKE